MHACHMVYGADFKVEAKRILGVLYWKRFLVPCSGKKYGLLLK